MKRCVLPSSVTEVSYVGCISSTDVRFASKWGQIGTNLGLCQISFEYCFKPNISNLIIINVFVYLTRVQKLKVYASFQND